MFYRHFDPIIERPCRIVARERETIIGSRFNVFLDRITKLGLLAGRAVCSRGKLRITGLLGADVLLAFTELRFD